MKYTNEEYARSYTEILEIFKYIPENLIKKIPESMIKRFYQNMDKNHVFLYDINWINRQSMFFSVKIVCLIDIYFYFCHSLLSSEGSSFLIFLLRTVIYYISLQKNPLNFSRRL